MHSGDRSLAGDVEHLHSASGISEDAQNSADGYILGGGIDIAPIIAATGERGSCSPQLGA